METSIEYIDAKQVPQERIDSMARTVLAAVRKAFEDPQVAADFEIWKAARAHHGETSRSCS